jgi:hypothetical protein
MGDETGDQISLRVGRNEGKSTLVGTTLVGIDESGFPLLAKAASRGDPLSMNIGTNRSASTFLLVKWVDGADLDDIWFYIAKK